MNRALPAAIVAAGVAAAIAACESDDASVSLPGGDASTGDGASEGAMSSSDSATSSSESAGGDAAADVTGPKGDGAAAVAEDAADEGGDVASAGPDAAPLANVAYVRVADWSADAPAVDFCLARHGTGAFTGPVVADLAAALADAGTPLGADLVGLAFGQASAYVAVAPATYDARVVAAGAGGCDAPVGPDATSLAAVAAGDFATFPLIGRAQRNTLRILALTDDLGTATTVALRFVQADPMLSAVDVGTGAGATFTPIFVGLPFGQASDRAYAPGGASSADDASPPSDASTPAGDASGSRVDGQGYAIRTSALGAPVSARASGATADAVATHDAVDVALGAAVTFVVTDPSSGYSGVVECVDNGASASLLSPCMPLP